MLKKKISGGRLKGMTDINPMWRVKTLTEQFGPCGIGWKWKESEHWIETSMGSDEIAAFVRGALYIKSDGEWSEPIEGIGGSMFASMEKGGLYVNDECYKMATTDAISVACKMLGIGADVYFEKDNTKHDDSKREYAGEVNQIKAEEERLKKTVISAAHVDNIRVKVEKIGFDLSVILNEYNVDDISKLTEAQYGDCMNKLEAEALKKRSKK